MSGLTNCMVPDISACHNFNCHLQNVQNQYHSPGVPWTRTYRFISVQTQHVYSHNPISFCNTKNLLTKHEKLMNKKAYIFNNANNSNTTSCQLTKAQKHSMMVRGHSANGYRRTTYASQSETHSNANSYNRHQLHQHGLHICPPIPEPHCAGDHPPPECIIYDNTFPPWPGPATYPP